MRLDELDQLVQTLRDRIKAHQLLLSGNEQATRYALINPLLAGLGWNLADPSEFLPEFGGPAAGRPDYAMVSEGEPYLVVEAKKLGTPIDGTHNQVGGYLLNHRVQYGVATNGDEWRGYDSRSDERVVFKFQVSNPSSSPLSLLWLWRGNFVGKTRRRPVPVPGVPEQKRFPSPPNGRPLPDVRYKKGMATPRRLFFPERADKNVSKSWARVQVATAEWLVETGKVGGLPLCNNRGTLLMTEERDAGRLPKAREIARDRWIGTNLDPTSHLRRARELLEQCGVDPHTVYVET